jgi:putative tryptophan/tyrosine transport system substrate-binding protein
VHAAIGVLTPLAADDAESMARIAAFLQGLGDLGWAVGRNVRIDYRWSAGDPDRIRKDAMELVALAPDVILATGTPVTSALQQASLSVPIVFAQVPDPVANGFVASLARLGGNTTGFTTYDYAASAKWVEILKEVAPGVRRAAVLRDPTIASGIGQLGAVLAVAPSLGMELSPIGVRNAGEIDRAITAFAREMLVSLTETSSPMLEAAFTDLVSPSA